MLETIAPSRPARALNRLLLPVLGQPRERPHQLGRVASRCHLLRQAANVVRCRGNLTLKLFGRNEQQVFVREVEAGFEVGQQIQESIAERRAVPPVRRPIGSGLPETPEDRPHR